MLSGSQGISHKTASGTPGNDVKSENLGGGLAKEQVCLILCAGAVPLTFKLCFNQNKGKEEVCYFSIVSCTQ